MNAMRRLRLISTAVVAFALLPGSPFSKLLGNAPAAWAQVVTGKRLILKDGSYQLVRKYQIVGDRVRYLSEERDDWEEVPYSLVDWPATNKWNQEHSLTPQGQPIQPPDQPNTGQPNPGESEAAKIDSEAAAERTALMEQMPAVAPGLQLPNLDGIFALDNFQNIPELIQLNQTAGDVNRGGTHNVLRAAIGSFRGAQEPVRINGQAAKIRLHVDDPTLYVSLNKLANEQVDSESAFVVNTQDEKNPAPDRNAGSSPTSRYAIVRVEVVPGERVIGALRLRRLNGQIVQSEDIVPTTAQVLPGGYWMKLTPKEPLTIGEYALMEILAPGEINLDVWDFGVDPDAPENPHPVTPIKP
jgi:hypothetical protein